MALLKEGLHPDASAALVAAGVGAGRVGQTIGGAPASANTHKADGTAGGKAYCAACDLKVNNGANALTNNQVKALIKKLSEVGFAAYFRNPGQDGWPADEVRHVHAVFAGCKMKKALRNQVHDYLHGKNGLASHGAYNFFQPSQEAENTIRALFLANNPAVGAAPGSDFLLDDLDTSDPNVEQEYKNPHIHGEDDEEEPGDELASTLPDDDS